MPAPPREVVPLCPRCGYDQSGACAAWTTECPLEGTCPECGLRFEWADAIDPHRKRLPWLFEHKQRWSPGLLRAIRSWVMALTPGRFWRRVRPEYAVPWVVVLWPLVLTLLLAVTVGVARSVYLLSTGYQSPWRGALTVVAGKVVPVTPAWSDRVYDTLAEGFLTPWILNPGAWRYADGLYSWLIDIWATPLAVVGASAVTGVTLLSLRASRRICGVKGSHILRATVYRLAPLWLLYVVWCVLSLLWMSVPSVALGYRLSAVVSAGLSGVCVFWGFWWWHATLKHGWLMRDARLPIVLISVVDALAGIVWLVCLQPRSLMVLFM